MRALRKISNAILPRARTGSETRGQPQRPRAPPNEMDGMELHARPQLYQPIKE